MRAPAILLALLAPALALVPTLVPAVASADKAVVTDGFETLASQAIAIDSIETMQGLLWSQDAKCDGAANELLRLQCEGVLKSHKAWVSERSYLIDASGSAIQTALSSDKKSVDVTLNACVQCEIADSLVLGLGDYLRSGVQIDAPLVTKVSQKFADAKEAESWNKRIGQRLRAQFVVKMPATAERFTDGDLAGYKVEVVGYRLYNPCKGNVLSAKPLSTQGPVDSEACAADPVKKLIVKKVPIVDRLSAKQIKKAIEPARQQSKACHKIYNIEGHASYKIVIGGDGSMVEMVQKGDFIGTPTGMCLDEAMAKVRFPKSKKAQTKINYPILLR